MEGEKSEGLEPALLNFFNIAEMKDIHTITPELLARAYRQFGDEKLVNDFIARHYPDNLPQEK